MSAARYQIEVIDLEDGSVACYVGDVHSSAEEIIVHRFPGREQVVLGLPHPYVFDHFWKTQAYWAVVSNFVNPEMFDVQVKTIAPAGDAK